MQPSTAPTDVQDEFADHHNVAGRGRAIYNDSLKHLLEPTHDGQAIAIHVDSGDYAIASTVGNAMRAMRAKHSSGPLFLRRIGSEPEYGLAARLFGSSISGRRK
jgi:hypothetical protein